MRVRNAKLRDTPVEALVDVVSDRGSTPLASTTIYTHADEVPQNGTASAFCFSKTLLKLLSVSREREEVNNYLYKMGIILTYLPHLEILGSMGRPETYNKS
jgi:hypothetical protein